MAGQGSGKPGDLGCTERVRERHLGRWQTDDAIAVEVLHQIVSEMVEKCGISPLKAHRLARGWTVPQVIGAFHAMCRLDGVKSRGLVARSWLEWEAGARPSWDYQDLVSRLFQTSVIGLGWANDYSPDEVGVGPGGRPQARSDWSIGADSYPHLVAERRRTRRQPLLQLPADVEDFAGRPSQIRQLVDVLIAAPRGSRTAVPIAMVTGKPGVGKTTLAIHVAHKVRQTFPDGQLYSNLRGGEPIPADPFAVLAGFLRELDVDDIPESLDERARIYRMLLAERRILVVLDNASDETQVRPLLPGNPDCAILITSRSRLAGIAGAHPVPLDIMPPEEAVEMLTTMLGEERVQGDPGALEDIARLCGYLPSALRIAAARLVTRPAFHISWFARKLSTESQRLDLLKAGDLEVRASFAVSYQGRDPEEQQAFRLLSLVSRGDFPAWNLAVLLDTNIDRAETLLEQLVDAELVEIAGVDAAGLIRYQFHDLLADFAKECLEEAESELSRKTCVQQLAEAYIAATQRACDVLHRTTIPTNTTSENGTLFPAAIVDEDPLGWFTAERSSLVFIVEQAYSHGLWDQAWRLTRTLPALFDWRADWQSWEHTHRLALEATHHLNNEPAQATILTTLGMLYRELGRYDAALTELTRAADIFLTLQDKPHHAIALRHIGDTFRYQGQLAKAIEVFTAALAEFRASGDLHSAAGALYGMADACRGLSLWEEADDNFRSCIAIYNKLNEPLEKARAQLRYAMLFRDRQRHEHARVLLRAALETFRSQADRGWEARALRQLAIVARNDGDSAQAVSLLGSALQIYTDLSDQRGLAVTLRNRGDSCRQGSDYLRAATDLKQALSIFTRLGDERWAARTRLSMAGLLRRQDKLDEAARHADSALQTFRMIPDRPAQGWALRELGIVLREQGRHRDADDALAEAERLFDELGDRLWQARALASRARLNSRDSGLKDVMLDRAVELCHRDGVTDDEKVRWILSEW